MDVSRLLPLQRAAHDGWLRWHAELGKSSGYVQSGGWMVAETAADVEQLHLKHGWETAAGIPTEVADGDTARRDNPPWATPYSPQPVATGTVSPIRH